MAQTIKIKRGGVGNLASLSLSTGEIALATGSLAAGIAANPFIVAGNSGNTLPVGAILTGSSTPSVNAKLNGALFYNSTDKQLIRLDSAGNQDLDIAATVENALTIGAGLFGTSFDGSAAVTISVNSGSIAINDLSGTLSVANGGTNATSFADKAVIISQDSGTDTLSALALTTNGSLVIGGTSGPAAATLTAGEGIDITNADGSITILGEDASITNKGIVELATAAEVTTGTDGTRAVTPDSLKDGYQGSTIITTLGTVTTGDVSAILPAGTVSGSEQVEDIVGGMLTGNTETLITVTYQDGDGTIDFVVDNNLANYSNASSNFSTVTQLNNSSSALQSNIDTNTSNISTNAGNITILTAQTSSYLQAADLSGYVNKTGTPLDNQIAIFTDADTVEGSANLTFDGTHLAIGGAGEVRFRDTALLIRSSQDGQLDAVADTKLNLQAPGVDIGNISTTTATTVNIGNSNNSATVNIKGNLNVAGTTTTVNSTIVNIDDNIIVLNYGGSETDGGIHVTDGPNTGSLLWDGTNNYWKGGALGSEKRVILEGASAGTANTVVKFDAAGTVINSTITDNGNDISLGGNVAITSGHTLTAPNAVTFSGLTGATNNTSAQVAFVGSDGKLGEVPITVDSSATATGFLAYSSDNVLEFVSTIDGGTF